MLLLSKSQKLKKGSLALNMFLIKFISRFIKLKRFLFTIEKENKIETHEKYFWNNG